jgi:hypothetical protein
MVVQASFMGTPRVYGNGQAYGDETCCKWAGEVSHLFLGVGCGSVKRRRVKVNWEG